MEVVREETSPVVDGGSTVVFKSFQATKIEQMVALALMHAENPGLQGSVSLPVRYT